MIRISLEKYMMIGGLITDMTAHFSLRSSEKSEAEKARYDDPT